MKVSVIVPMYNAAQYVDQCMKALLSQKFEDFEVICIDDGSNDNTLEILSKYECAKVKIIHQDNAGVYKARINAVSAATGNYVSFCDCDDIPHDDWIDKMYARAVSTDADLTVCGYRRIDENSGRTVSTEMVLDGLVDIRIDSLTPVIINTATWNKMYKIELFYDFFVPELTPRIGEDALFSASLYPHIKKTAFVPEVLYDYYVHSCSAISNVSSKDINITIKGFDELLILTENNKTIAMIAFVNCAVAMPLISNEVLSEKYCYDLFADIMLRRGNEFTIKDVVSCKFRFKIARVYILYLLYRLHLFSIVVAVLKFLSAKFGMTFKW